MSNALTLLTTQQAADLLGLNADTLKVQRHRGIGLPYVKIGRLIRYRLIELQAYIEARTVTPRAHATPDAA